MFYVYVLQSIKNGRLYTGHTSDLPRRIQEHNSGQTSSTRSKGPYQLIHVEQHESRSAAYCREMFLKTGAGRDELKRILKP